MSSVNVYYFHNQISPILQYFDPKLYKKFHNKHVVGPILRVSLFYSDTDHSRTQHTPGLKEDRVTYDSFTFTLEWRMIYLVSKWFLTVEYNGQNAFLVNVSHQLHLLLLGHNFVRVWLFYYWWLMYLYSITDTILGHHRGLRFRLSWPQPNGEGNHLSCSCYDEPERHDHESTVYKVCGAIQIMLGQGYCVTYSRGRTILHLQQPGMFIFFLHHAWLSLWPLVKELYSLVTKLRAFQWKKTCATCDNSLDCKQEYILFFIRSAILDCTKCFAPNTTRNSAVTYNTAHLARQLKVQFSAFSWFNFIY